MNLKKNFGKSSVWMSTAASGNSLISFIIFIMLSRLLTPEEIGLVAFALIVVELGRVIVNAGFAQAIVRHPEWDESYAATCFYLNLLLAALLTAVIFWVVAPLTAFYYDPRAEFLVQVLSIIFFLEGAKAVQEGKLKREFNFRAIALRTLVASLISGVAGVTLALLGYGVWALVWQQLINQILITVITWKSAHWLPRWQFSTAYLPSLMGFSAPLTLAQLAGNLATKIYEMLIGLLIGPAALGFYRIGDRVLFIMQEIVIKPFEQALLPALSRLSELEARAQATLRVMRISAYFTFPIFFGAAAIGPEFITLAFTEKWAQSGQVMTVLALGIAPTVISAQVNAAMTASGHTNYVMALSVIQFMLNCILGLLLVPYGIVAAAAGYALRAYLSIIFNMLFFKTTFHIDIKKQLATIAPTFIAAVLMFLGVQLLKLVLPVDISLGIRLILLAAAGGFIYAVIMSCIFRTETKHFLGESAAVAPAKAKPAIHYLQRVLRLA